MYISTTVSYRRNMFVKDIVDLNIEHASLIMHIETESFY